MPLSQQALVDEFPPELASLVTEMSRGTGQEVRGEAAILNYFRPDDVMCGHVDKAEEDLTKAIVSISVGQTAIFLLGGETHDEAPVALYIRSGDVVIMGGAARTCVHGVPRVIAESIPDFIRDDIQEWESSQEVKEFFLEARVNINVRQVRPDGGAPTESPTLSV